MTIVDNTVLYNWNLLREQNLNVPPKNNLKEGEINMWGDRCVNYLDGGNLSQSIHLLNHQDVHLISYNCS